MITKGAEYSLRVVVLLLQNKGRPLVAAEISEHTKISVQYIPKVLKPLISAGLVSSARGINGGYALKKSGKQISILDIIKVAGCMRDDHTERAELGDCLHPLCRKLEQIDAHVLRIYARTTIAQLVAR